IGAAPGNVAEKVVLQTNSHPTVTFKQHAPLNTYLGYMTLRLALRVGIPPVGYPCLEIRSSPTIEHCVIQSYSTEVAAVGVGGSGTEPRIRFCDISDSKYVGLVVCNRAGGTYEHNKISRNARIGVMVQNCANPVMRRNCIHDH